MNDIWPKDWPRECWLVHGVDSRGGPFYARHIDSPASYLPPAKVIAAEQAATMNAYGAEVEIKRQVLPEDSEVWIDA